MSNARTEAPSIQPEDYRAILQGLCVANWCAAGLALLLELIIRGLDAYAWPQWGNFSWTYNLVLAEFVAVTLGLTFMLRDTAWLDRAPRQALDRLRWLLLAVLVLDGLHVLGFLQLTGALQGPMMMVLPLGIITLYLLLPRRDAHLVNGVFLLALLLMLLAQDQDGGMLAPAFDPSQGASLPWALIVCASLLGALAIGTLAGGRMESVGISLQRRVSYDPNTLLFTREVLERRVPGELGRIGRSESSAALMMVEFKNLGDLIPPGDYETMSKATRQFADGLRAATRKADTCAQYGLNTFAVLLPTASAKTATAVAQRIQECADGIRAGAGADSVQLAVGIAATGTAARTDAGAFIAASQEALREAWNAGSGHQVVVREV